MTPLCVVCVCEPISKVYLCCWSKTCNLTLSPHCVCLIPWAARDIVSPSSNLRLCISLSLSLPNYGTA